MTAASRSLLLRRHLLFATTNLLSLTAPTSTSAFIHALPKLPPLPAHNKNHKNFNLQPLSTKLAALSDNTIMTIPNSNSNNANNDTIDPPIARREEDRVSYAGSAPPNWNPANPRQAANDNNDDDNNNKLITPPTPIPDPYAWLRDDSRTNPEVLSHLQRENEYSTSCTSHLDSLRSGIYDEFLNSLQETDYSTPRPRGDWWYYTRTVEGLSYRLYCRAPRDTDSFTIGWDGTKDSPILPNEQVYLDVNALAQNKSYCSMGVVEPSPSHEWIAYTVDYSGDEIYELHVKNVVTGEDVVLNEINAHESEDSSSSSSSGGEVEKQVLETSDSIEWGNNDTTLYYMTMDEQQRPYRLYQRQDWNTDNPSEVLLKEEMDELYWCDVSKSLDGMYIFFEVASKETSEIWYLATTNTNTNTTESIMQCIAPRQNKVLYQVEHAHNQWYIWTNIHNSPNMKLMTSPAIPNSSAQWTLLLDANDEPLFDGSLDVESFKALESVTVLNRYLVMEGREDGIPRIWIYDLENKGVRRLEFEEEDYDTGLLGHYESDATSIGVSYDSMVTPTQTIDISLDDDTQRNVLKSTIVPGYDKDHYDCDRLQVLSRDGTTKIPISIVYSKETMEKVTNGQHVPVHLYGYGSYGSSVEADFDATRLPLLERGMIYVIAHIRGGGEMGRQWYEEPNGAKYLCKKNTFNDFVDVAKFLVEEKKWTTPDMLSCEGRSAGGMLVGASINQAPELFRVAILGVPFVDVVVTMTDSTIPLTSGEWVEWGNPNEEKFFQYMMEYSPMNNVQTGKTYPACWLTGGLHDPRVAYWEPAKFAATLRHANPDNPNPICLKMDLSAGHFSASDRYKYFKELAIDYAFLLDQLKLV